MSVLIPYGRAFLEKYQLIMELNGLCISNIISSYTECSKL